MKLIGVRTSDGTVHVAQQGEHPREVKLLARVEDFWNDPQTIITEAADALAERPAVPLEQFTVVPPVLPGARVFCVGLNYRDHVAEGSYATDEYPPYPTIFSRWPSTLSVDGDSVPIPSQEPGLDWEGEIVAYVGRTLVDADPDSARGAVIGYSAFNDLTSRTAQKLTSQWILGKNGDRSGPLGPLVTADEVGDLRDGIELETYVNGTLVQRGNTRDQIYELGEVLSHLSHTVTLRPGDLIATGTPSGVGYARTPAWFLQPGDEVWVSAGPIGTVRTPIVGNEARLVDAAAADRGRHVSASGH